MYGTPLCRSAQVLQRTRSIISAILAMFPDLAPSGSSSRRRRKARFLGVNGAPIEAPAAAPRRRKRRKMTAAEKNAASDRMKRYRATKKKAAK